MKQFFSFTMTLHEFFEKKSFFLIFDIFSNLDLILVTIIIVRVIDSSVEGNKLFSYLTYWVRKWVGKVFFAMYNKHNRVTLWHKHIYLHHLSLIETICLWGPKSGQLFLDHNSLSYCFWCLRWNINATMSPDLPEYRVR